jgi:phosphate:Na+ symporter
MGFTDVLQLLGGLGLFLFGMKFMGQGLESAAGAKLSKIMEKLTGNPIKGFLFGVGATAVIQSSAAATVMVMGLVNAGIIDLAQATAVIIGSNVGTTITSILIALDISFIAPLCIFAGGILLLYGKKKGNKKLGQIVMGFGLLFLGLKMMSGSMKGLKDLEWFQNFLEWAGAWPILGLLIGLVLCAITQSSSASVGVAQALAVQGLMPLGFASCMVCGINVGSSMPTFISSFNAKNNAKRAAVIYFIYNVVGTLIFVPLTLFTPYTQWIQATGATEMFQISMLHIIFKLATAILLLPFSKLLVKLAYKIIPKVDHEGEMRLEYIDPKLKYSPSTAKIQIQKEVGRMAALARENLTLAVDGLMRRSLENADRIRDQEDMVDFLTNAISEYMISVNVNALPQDVSNYIGRVFHVVTDIERISDHAINIVEKTESFLEIDTGFSDTAKSEVGPIMEKNLKLYDLAIKDFLADSAPEHDLIAMHNLENSIDELTKEAQNNHVNRLRAKECNTETGIIFVQLMHDLERVGDHSYNIGWLSNAEGATVRELE